MSSVTQSLTKSQLGWYILRAYIGQTAGSKAEAFPAYRRHVLEGGFRGFGYLRDTFGRLRPTQSLWTGANRHLPALCAIYSFRALSFLDFQRKL